jgi:predicted phosphodiesterase
MKLKIFCDTHLGSTIEMKPDGLFIADENTILAGDIVDMSNVKHKMIGYYKELYDELRMIHGDNYIIGNHEKMGTENEFVIKTTESGTRICILHGDIEANPKRWIRYRQEPHGAGWIKRTFLIPLIREAEEIIERNPKKEILDRMAFKAYQLDCDVYVCGHFHSKEKLELSHFYLGKTYKIIILPRGMTELEFE